MAIYSNVKAVCKSKGISVMKLETELGFARSSIYKWNKHQPGIGKTKCLESTESSRLSWSIHGVPAVRPEGGELRCGFPERNSRT